MNISSENKMPMYPGLTTFNQIINDSLMPWLSTYGDEKPLRKLIIYIENDIANNDKCFFLSLTENINHASIKVKDNLIEEWKYLSKQDYNYSDDGLFNKINKIVWPETIVNFYIRIAINCAFSHLLWLKNTVSNETDNRVIGFKVMRSLRDIGQLIIDCKNNKNEINSSENLIDIISMILAFVWLKILSIYHKYIYMDGLPLIKEEVIYHITYRENSTTNFNIIRVAILQELNLLEETAARIDPIIELKHVDEEMAFQKNDITEISQDLRSDMDSIKQLIKNKKIKKEIKPEYLKPKEACLLLDISKTTLNTWRKKGFIKDYHLLGNRYEYNKHELNKLKTQLNENKGNN